jgi:hypothetical protein
MSVDADGASGPQGNAAEGKMDLDAALNAALGSLDTGDDIAPSLVKAKMDDNARKESERKNAGDARTSEDAGKPAKPGGDAPEAPAAEAVSAAIEAPNHWDAERKQAFAALPPEAQKAMLAMAKNLEGGFTRKSQELSDQAKFAETVRGLFKDHHRQQLTQAGLDEVGAIQYLMQLQDFASRDLPGYVRWLIHQNGLTPEHLGFPTRQPTPQQHQPQQPAASTGDAELDKLLAASDPEVAKLRSEFGQYSQQAAQRIAQLEGFLANQWQAQQDYARQQQVSHVQSLQKQWNDFRSAQDEHGQLAYPHADALMQPMGALMDTHPILRGMPDGPEKIAKAYQMALAADPELSKPIFEAEVSKRLTEQQKKAEAEKAKAAAKVKPASGAPTAPVKRGGLDAALNDAWAQHGGT